MSAATTSSAGMTSQGPASCQPRRVLECFDIGLMENPNGCAPPARRGDDRTGLASFVGAGGGVTLADLIPPGSFWDNFGTCVKELTTAIQKRSYANDTAVLSALNSGLFASSRMLMALAGRGDAPRAAARLDGRGVPVAAILASTAFGYVTVVMSYLSPDKIFAFLVNSYGTVAIFVYVLIAVAELRLRRRLEQQAPERLRIRMWGYPWLTRIAIAAMLAILAAMAVIPDQRVSLAFGLVSAAILLGAWLLRFFLQREAHR